MHSLCYQPLAPTERAAFPSAGKHSLCNPAAWPGRWATVASPSRSKGDSHEDSRFDKAGHAGNHCQVASDLQFPNSSSLLGPAARVDQQDKP